MAGSLHGRSTYTQRFIANLVKGWKHYSAIIILLIGITSLIGAVIANKETSATAHRLRDYIACQTRYNTINNERIRALTPASDDERMASRAVDDALSAFVQAAYQGKPRDIQVDLFQKLNEALQKLKTVRGEADAVRDENPIPPPPEDVCGPVP